MPFTPLNKTTASSSFTPLGSVAEKPKLSESLWDKVIGIVKSRGEKAGEALYQGQTGKQSPLSATLQAVGQGAGAVGDIGFEAAKSITPEFIAKPVGEAFNTGVQKITGTQSAQDVMAKYQEFKTAHPEAAANLEATGLIASILPVGKGATIGAKGIEEAGKKTVQTAIKTGEKIGEVAETSAQKLVSSSLKLTPTQVRKIEMPNVAGMKPEQWLLNKGITGSPDEIANKLSDLAKTSKNELDKKLSDDILLGGIKQVYETPETVNQSLDVLRNVYKGTVGNDKKIARILELQSKETMTLPEINEVKRLIDENLSLYKTTGAVKEGAEAQGLRNLRNDIKTFIEQSADEAGVPDVKELNKTTQVAKEIEKAIRATEGRRGANRILSLTDLMVGTATGIGVNPIVGLGTVIGKKIIEDPKLKIYIANQLHKLAPETVIKLETALKEGTLDNNLKNAIKNLLLAAKKKYEEIPNKEGGFIKYKPDAEDIALTKSLEEAIKAPKKTKFIPTKKELEIKQMNDAINRKSTIDIIEMRKAAGKPLFG